MTQLGQAHNPAVSQRTAELVEAINRLKDATPLSGTWRVELGRSALDLESVERQAAIAAANLFSKIEFCGAFFVQSDRVPVLRVDKIAPTYLRMGDLSARARSGRR